MKIERCLLILISSLALISCNDRKTIDAKSNKDSIEIYSLDDYYKVEYNLVNIVDSTEIDWPWQKETRKSEKPWRDPLVVYSVEDSVKLRQGKIKIVDTVCINGLERARKSIAQNDLTYFEIRGLAPGEVSDKEFEALLTERNIKFRNVSRGCVPPPEGFRYFCYEEEINAEISRRFGDNFIDSLRHQADLEFVETHPKYVFSLYELEATIRYGNKNGNWEKENDKLQDDFRNAVFDGKYDPKIDLYFNFVIYRNGNGAHLELERGKEDSSTPAQRAIWKRKASGFIANAKWHPANYRGILVNSNYFLEN